ncbi:GNAT family N-acetyltransferase [Aurantimonas sp. VKM B-3413]|uniref:GNAT family N-acetyltransferase n=1 Tax=Aurantimonas sp. VKM B-3413 TaxID=2779401 RepID=UPI001E45DFD8|nr:GNAT family N-acetyltransferase [Aurantimonas sp. VKM B-3413]MCB8840561.1 GNAT family N-acetyltransferase [Aurantimonas sp. VKM B-3413]
MTALSKPDLVVRAAEPADAAGLAALANLPGYRRNTLRLPFESVEATKRRLFESGKPGPTLLVACRGETIVGTASLNRLAGRRSHVGQIGMGVHDAYLRQGIGWRLLTALIDLGDNWLGLTRLELDVMVDNEAAIALYERAGFVEEGVARAAVIRDGVLVDTLWMARLKDAPVRPD